MRRGLLKDLANTPTAMACGWRLYEDIGRLTSLAGQTVTIDLLLGTSRVDGVPMHPPLAIAHDVTRWMRERFDSDDIPPGLVTSARLTLAPQIEGGLVVQCATTVDTQAGTYESSDMAKW